MTQQLESDPRPGGRNGLQGRADDSMKGYEEVVETAGSGEKRK